MFHLAENAFHGKTEFHLMKKKSLVRLTMEGGDSIYINPLRVIKSFFALALFPITKDELLWQVPRLSP
jgi:hypothetical protein